MTEERLVRITATVASCRKDPKVTALEMCLVMACEEIAAALREAWAEIERLQEADLKADWRERRD